MSRYAVDADILRILAIQVRLAGSMRAWAKANNFSPAFVSGVLSGTMNVTDRLAAALGYERARVWVKIKES